MIQKTINQDFRHKIHFNVIKLCHSLDMPLHYNRKGPKSFTNYQRVGLIVLFLRSRKSLRKFIEELDESKWLSWLGLKKKPKKSTLHDWLQLFDLKLIRLLIQSLLSEEKPSIMAIDGTGIDSWKRSRHYEHRIGDSHMPYAKFEILIDTDTKLIHDFVLRTKPRHDVLGATTMCKRMKHQGIKFVMDKGFDSELLHKLIRSMGNILYAPVRNSPRKVPKGFYRKKCVNGDPDYGKRNSIESTIKVFKQTIIGELRSKKHYMKKREIAWGVLVYNIERINKITSLILLRFLPQSGHNLLLLLWRS